MSSTIKTSSKQKYMVSFEIKKLLFDLKYSNYLAKLFILQPYLLAKLRALL